MVDTNTLIEWRHHLHQHPEIGFDTHDTAAFVATKLAAAGLEVHSGIGQTGVVGILRRGQGKGAIALRADMDALPLTEENTFAHCSRRPGAMHACGHDGHTTMLLGAAARLAASGQFDGTVVFLFQPNEEFGDGALAMLADGVFDRFPVDRAFGLHNLPGLPVGHFHTRPQAITASEALFDIDISASGGHAALPHMGVDAITVGSALVGALQHIVSRRLDPADNGVVSVTEFTTDGRRNVLPGNATLRGDARALSPEANAIIEREMRRLAGGVASAHGADVTVSYNTHFPATINHPDAVAIAASAAALVNQSEVNAACAPKLFSEDFAHFTKHVPSCFMLAGNGIEGAHARALHATDYDFNDALIEPGVQYWIHLVESALSPT